MRPTCATAEPLKWARLLNLIIAKCKNSPYIFHVFFRFQSQQTVPRNVFKLSQLTHLATLGEICIMLYTPMFEIIVGTLNT